MSGNFPTPDWYFACFSDDRDTPRFILVSTVSGGGGIVGFFWGNYSSFASHNWVQSCIPHTTPTLWCDQHQFNLPTSWFHLPWHHHFLCTTYPQSNLLIFSAHLPHSMSSKGMDQLYSARAPCLSLLLAIPAKNTLLTVWDLNSSCVTWGLHHF